MHRHHFSSLVEVEVEATAARCYQAVAQRHWLIQAHGIGGLICAPPKPGAPALDRPCCFELTWRRVGNQTNLSVFGPLAPAPPLDAGTDEEVRIFERELIRAFAPHGPS